MSMTTLGSVYEGVRQLSNKCEDEMVDVKRISFDSLEIVQIGSDYHYVKPIAQQHMSNRLGIPMQYLKKCSSDLQAVNLNHWIRKERNEKLFFRFEAHDVRAVFTPRYRPVDNLEILERLYSLDYRPDTVVQSYIDPDFMLISIPDSNRAFSFKGDTMYPGISVSNSEVGLASLSLAVFVLRLVCTNGMISKTEVSASYRHVSSRIMDEFPNVMGNIRHELERKRNQIKLSMESKVDDPLSTINNFNKQFQLGQSEAKAVEWAWPMEEGDTMFNIINVYTRASQHRELSAESSYKLQKVGGTVLAMIH